jgi:hypothetical protein
MKLHRSSPTVDEIVHLLSKWNESFRILHGTYSTIIETEASKIKFAGAKFSNRVFIASQMIKKDVVNSDFGREIMQQSWNRSNYQNNELLQPFRAKRVLNIDISGAYASCLRVNNLITDKTFHYLQRLKKDERLPACGMLARTYTVFTYECGEITDVEVQRSATAQVFYYLIAEINNIMQALQFELGKYFYFYWVDGIFFQHNTPDSIVKACEKILLSRGYRFKYELVENFSLSKNQDIYTIKMVKNGDPKIYKFTDSNIGRQITELLNEKAKQYNLQPGRA